MGVTPTAPPSPNSGRNLSPAEPSRWAPAPAKLTPAEILDNNCQKDRSSGSPPVHPLFPLHPRNSNPKMGDLPEARVRPSRPFSKTGSDYAGPFWVRPNSLRNSNKIKAYTCIFVCMATKAVHIEVAEDLTTDSFLAALSRFSNRRGAPTDLYTDCGTNYVGADNELKRIVKELNEYLHALPQPTGLADFPRTTFHFNPPGAPHFGGLWEAAVKSMKKHIHKVTLDHPGDKGGSHAELATYYRHIFRSVGPPPAHSCAFFDQRTPPGRTRTGSRRGPPTRQKIAQNPGDEPSHLAPMEFGVPANTGIPPQVDKVAPVLRKRPVGSDT